MYTDSQCPNLYGSELGEGEERFPSIETITDSVTKNAAQEAICKRKLVMHGLDHWDLRSELRALNEVAKIRVRAAAEETTALAFGVDYERSRDSRIIFGAKQVKATLHVSATLPHATNEEPFYSRDKHLSEIKEQLIYIYVQQIVDYSNLIRLEQAGRLNASANEVYEQAVKNVVKYNCEVRNG